MKKKPVDQFYLVEMYNLWKSYPAGSKSRGEVVRRFMSERGVSKVYVHKVFNELESGQNLSQVANRKKRSTRLTPEQKAARDKFVDAVATVKYMDKQGAKTYVKDTDFAIMQADNMGLLKDIPVKIPSTSTVRRWLKDAGLNKSSYSRVLASRSWDIDAPNVLWMTDASPANMFYLNKSDTVIHRPDISPQDTHLEEILHRENLRKVHIYIVVDVFSGAWFAKAFASDPIGANSKRTGENSVDFRSTLIEAMKPKYNSHNPFEGVPQILYSDKGSAFGPLRPFFDKLEIEFKHHFPNNPKAKGYAEGGLSAIKRSFETRLSRYTIRNIDDFNELLENYMVHNNQKRKTYDKFVQGAIQNPIRKLTEKNIHDVLSRELERVVDAYGCVSVNKKLLGVGMEIVGVKVKLFEKDGKWIAKDPEGNIYECDPNGKVKNSIDGFETYRTDEEGNKIPVKDWKHSEKLKRRNRIIEEGKIVAKTALKEDLLYPESNLRHFPAASFKKDTHSTLAPDVFESVEAALNYIYAETGLAANEIPPVLFAQLKSSLEIMSHDKITNSLVYKLVNILNKSISRLEAINEK